MKAKLFFISLLLSITTLLSANNPGSTNALLWKISGNGLEKPSYILGTFHLADKTMLDSIPGANAALDDCEQVVGEIVMGDMMAMAQTVQLAGMMPADTTYQMLYSEEEYKKVDEGVKAYLGAGLDQIGMLKPSLVSTTISMLIYQTFFPEINLNEVMDNYVQQYAISAGKPVVGLETIEEQINVLFNSSPLKRQADQLLCLLENIEDMHSSAVELIEAYNSKDLTTIHALISSESDPCRYSQEEMDALIKNRNDDWIKKLPTIILEKSSFVAVGAGHLVGDDGILTQLKTLGYTVEPYFTTVTQPYLSSSSPN